MTGAALAPVLVALTPNPPSGDTVTVVVVAGAGNGPSAFAPWIQHTPPGWQIVAACLPGRGHRIGEPVPPDLYAAADEIAAAVDAEVLGPVILCGHSMGALLALETAHRLRETRVAMLVALACTPPDIPPDYSALDDEKIRRLVRDQIAQGGIDDPEMLTELTTLAAGMLRADLQMLDGYTAPATPSYAPIVAYYGDRDDLPPASWARHTTAGAPTVILPGGHRFCHDDPAALLTNMSSQIGDPDCSVPPAPPHSPPPPSRWVTGRIPGPESRR